MVKQQDILQHKGSLSYEHIGLLLNKMTEAVDKLGMSLTVKKKVYSAMVETLENIYRHQDPIDNAPQFMPNFTLSVDHEKFSILASNSLKNFKIEPLQERLDKVNALDKPGIKELYKSTILSGSISPKGGAGLGIINIAKVSENKINYTIDNIDGQFSYFTIHVTITHRKAI